MADYYGSSRKGSYGGYNSRRSSRNDEDFEEGDVWGVDASEREDSSSPKMKKSNHKKDKPSSSSSAWKFSAGSSTPRMTIAPPARNEANKLVLQSSSPVNIPDWSKIYGKKGNEIVGSTYSSFNDECGYDDVDNYNYCGGGGGGGGDDDDDVEEEEEDMVPPHEWLAKKLARNQISSFSVCEGVGRTLKGRDLSKVRNAVLTKTGFLE